MINKPLEQDLLPPDAMTGLDIEPMQKLIDKQMARELYENVETTNDGGNQPNIADDQPPLLD